MYGYFYPDVLLAYFEKAGHNNDVQGRSRRQLDAKEIKDFEMIVEDRNGNKLKYNLDGDIIEENPDEEEPVKYNGSSINTLNILLLLCLILFLR